MSLTSIWSVSKPHLHSLITVLGGKYGRLCFQLHLFKTSSLRHSSCYFLTLNLYWKTQSYTRFYSLTCKCFGGVHHEEEAANTLTLWLTDFPELNASTEVSSALRALFLCVQCHTGTTSLHGNCPCWAWAQPNCLGALLFAFLMLLYVNARLSKNRMTNAKAVQNPKT